MPVRTNVSQKIKAAGGLKQSQNEPLWKGPTDPGPMGGISQSMIGRYPSCPERFRVRYVEGWKMPDRFDHKLGYGHFWHICEQHFAAGELWIPPLLAYAKKQAMKYPMQREEIHHWFKTCTVQFPIYTTYWKQEKDVVSRTPLMQEMVVNVPYKLPNGVTTCLRGKLDGADLLPGKNGGVYLVEHKTKGDVDLMQMKRQLNFDLQTMFYLVVLQAMQDQGGLADVEIKNGVKKETKLPIRGVRYNVIRRPFGGGKGSIRKRQATEGSKCPKCKGGEKPGITRCDKCEGRGRIGAKPEETDEEFYDRLHGVIDEMVFKDGKPIHDNDWFARWKVEIGQEEIDKYKREFLDPVLMNLTADYNWWKVAMERGISPFDHKAKMLHEVFGPRFYYHWRLPFGTFNQLTDGNGASDVDQYLEDGSTVGLVKATTLFEELSE